MADTTEGGNPQATADPSTTTTPEGGKAPEGGKKTADTSDNKSTKQPDAPADPADKSGKQPPSDPPAVPEKYELKLPDTSPFTDADLPAFSAEAKAMGLSQEAAQAMVDARVQFVQENSAQYLADLKADKELGGDKFDETKALALKGRDVLFPPDTEEATLINGWFERTGLGNHKALVRAFARLGRMVSEDNIVTGGQPAKGEKTQAEKLYPDMKS